MRQREATLQTIELSKGAIIKKKTKKLKHKHIYMHLNLLDEQVCRWGCFNRVLTCFWMQGENAASVLQSY